MESISYIKEDIIPMSYFIKYSKLEELLNGIIDQDKKVNLYFDVKNIISGLHTEDVILDVIFNYNNGNDISKIAKSIIVLANHYKKFFIKRNIECNIIFFDDRGVSKYHQNISKEYKKDRQQSRTKLSESIQRTINGDNNFPLIYDKNVSMLNKMFKHMDNISFINLTNLESDFIPYFYIKEECLINGKIPDINQLHFIFSNDKDYSQLLIFPNIFRIVKKSKLQDYILIDRNNAMESFLKKDNEIDNILLKDGRFIPLILSIAGDPIDGVYGVNGLGYIKVYKIIEDLYKNNIITNKDISAEIFLYKLKEYCKISSKYMQNIYIKKILHNADKILLNYKLVSFSELYNSLLYSDKKDIKEKYSRVIENRANRNDLIYNLFRICSLESSFNYLI